MPIHSASDYGLGQYFVTFKVGTPAQKVVLLVDTGSELTWMNCRYKCSPHCGGRNVNLEGRINRHRVFWADLSSSFKTVPCLSSMCKVELANLFSLTTCPSPDNPCKFDFRYLDGSTSLGFFANETVSLGLTNGRRAKLNDMLIGCSDTFDGESFDKGADGVMGLAHGKYSFTTKATQIFGGKFSYCLVDHLSPKNLTNYLIFGSTSRRRQEKLLAKTRYTQLELDLIKPFYAVTVIGISVGKTMLDIPPMVWDIMEGGGTILDTGTTLTVLSEPAYRPVMDALEAALDSKYERVMLDDLPMEFCFNSTGFDEKDVPKLGIHFADGNRFNPYPRSYIIPVADGINCIGLMVGSWPSSSIIGNIMQQSYLWEFDLVGRRLGFTPSTCT